MSGFVETLRSLRPWFVETLRRMATWIAETLSDQLDALAESLKGEPPYDSTFMVGGFDPDGKDPTELDILSSGPSFYATDAHMLVGLLGLPPCGDGHDGLLDHEWKVEPFQEALEEVLEDPWKEIDGIGRVPLSGPTQAACAALLVMIEDAKAEGMADRVALQMDE